MRGWFDLGRDEGAPAYYAASNRTTADGDYTTITFGIAFLTLLIAFFVIFPGIRKERFTTFTSVTLSLFVGMCIVSESAESSELNLSSSSGLSCTVVKNSMVLCTRVS